MQMSPNCGQSSFEALLHNYGKYHKTNSMTTRQEDQAAIYNDPKDTSTPQHHSLDTTLSTKSIMDLDDETAAEYSEDTHPQKDLAQLQEHFQQLQERLNQLGATTSPPTHTEELTYLTEKLQKLALTLQPCPTCGPVDESLQTTMQQYTDTLCATQ